MNFRQLAESRFSLRHYDSRPVEEEKINYLLECVRLAPSAVNFQPSIFYVVTNKDLLSQLQGCYNREWFKTAPMCMVACGNHEQAWHRKLDNKDHTDIDVAIAVDHLILATFDVGLGSCWVCNFDAQKVAEILELPDHLEPMVLVPIGYAATDEKPLKKRKSLDELVIYKK